MSFTICILPDICYVSARRTSGRIYISTRSSNHRRRVSGDRCVYQTEAATAPQRFTGAFSLVATRRRGFTNIKRAFHPIRLRHNGKNMPLRVLLPVSQSSSMLLRPISSIAGQVAKTPLFPRLSCVSNHLPMPCVTCLLHHLTGFANQCSANGSPIFEGKNAWYETTAFKAIG